MKLFSRNTFTAGTVATIATLSGPKPACAAPSFKWKLGHDEPVEDPANVRIVEATDRIRAETGGQLDIRVFPNSTLGSDPAMLEQLRSGAIEMLLYPGGSLDSVVPVSSIENVAFAFPTRKAAFGAMDGQLGALIRQDIRAKNMVPFDSVWEYGYHQFTTSPRPIRTVDDIAGMKFRVSGGRIRVDMFRSLGASPTPIPVSELYTALQTHIVDGQETPLIVIESFHFYEVQKYCSLANLIWSGAWMLANEDAWRSLPGAFQTIVSKHINAAALLQRHDAGIVNTSVQDKLQRQGLTFNPVTVDGFRAKLAEGGYYTRWRNNYGPAAWAALETYCGRLG